MSSSNPAVRFVCTVTVSEEGEALAGQGVVYVGEVDVVKLQLDREHLEVPYPLAMESAVQACRDWLKIQEATKELAATPSEPQERPAKRQGATPGRRRRGTGSPGPVAAASPTVGRRRLR